MYPENVHRLTGEPTPDYQEAEYRIRTYDVEAGDYTPQDGIPEIVTGFRGLLMALRLLKAEGYSCDRRKHGGSDPSVLVERISPLEP